MQSKNIYGDTMRNDTFSGAVSGEIPYEIISKDIEFFEVGCSFAGMFPACEYEHIYGYAARVDSGFLTVLTVSDSNDRAGGSTLSAVVSEKCGLFDDLYDISVKYHFEKNNGHSQFVNGIPAGFGGTLEIYFASGEKITVYDNRSSIISPNAGSEIVSVFKKHISESRIKTSDCGTVKTVTYMQSSSPDEYFTICLSGTRLTSEHKFGYEKNQIARIEKVVPDNVIETIRQTADRHLMLHWGGLREQDIFIPSLMNGKIEFELNDGTILTVSESMKKPAASGNIIFEIRSFLMQYLER